MGIEFDIRNTRVSKMKFVAVIAGSALAQYDDYGYPAAGYPADNYNSGACGPDAANGGAFWPSQSAEDTCGVQFWSDQVKANAKCMLQLTAGASKFLTLGGVFVTSPAADYNADTFYFHTYDNWKGAEGASVVNFWQNADFPSNSSCFNADAVCVTCTEEPDRDYDGMPDMVQGVYLGNFMHDFRHASPSQTNVPIANSAGHINGTVYDIELMDQYGSPVPVTHISSHYGGMGHKIDSSVDADGNHFSDNGRFSIHVGCTDFLGQFLYFQFQHQGEMEANGWYSRVTARAEVPYCPDETATDAYGASDPYAQAGYGSDPYAAQGYHPAMPPSKPNRKPNKNKKQRGDFGDYNDTLTFDDGDYNYSY